MAADSHGRDDGPLQLAHFRVGDGHFAIDIMRIREVVTPLPITPVPGTPPFVEGIANLRGHYLPVIDLRRRFNLAPTDPRGKFIILDFAGGMCALIIDGIHDVIRVAPESIQGVEELGAVVPAMFTGVVSHDEDAVMVFDPDALLTAAESAALSSIDRTAV